MRVPNPILTVTIYSALRHRKAMLNHLRGTQPLLVLTLDHQGYRSRESITLTVAYRWRWRPFTAPRVTIG